MINRRGNSDKMASSKRRVKSKPPRPKIEYLISYMFGCHDRRNTHNLLQRMDQMCCPLLRRPYWNRRPWRIPGKSVAFLKGDVQGIRWIVDGIGGLIV